VRKKTSEFEKNARKAYLAKVKRLNFEGYYYETDVQPNVFFYKFLCKRFQAKNKHERLRVPIPDTIVFQDSGLDPFWLYSDDEGFVNRTTKFDDRDILRKMGN